MATARKRGAKGTERSELVAVRFDPRTKYMLEIAARVQRRSASSYIESAVEESMKTVELYKNTDGSTVSVWDAALGPGQKPLLWDPIPAARFALLGLFFPQLMNYTEQLLWKLIGEVWQLTNPEANFHPDQKDSDLLREHFDLLAACAAEGKTATATVEMMKVPKAAEALKPAKARKPSKD